eukprot:COSAG05_NODE_6023_length_1039_cov_63.210018_2_plen_70_part_00
MQIGYGGSSDSRVMFEPLCQNQKPAQIGTVSDSDLMSQQTEETETDPRCVFVCELIDDVATCHHVDGFH